MNSYGLIGSMTARSGKRDAVVAIILRGVEELRSVGCQSYVVGISEEYPDKIWVTEVWESKAAHKASLALPSVKQAIGEAMPMLTSEFSQTELSVVGGLGLARAADG